MQAPFSIIEKRTATESGPAEVRRTPLWKRRLATASRWLHTYLSMASFAILFFFAATGITLNHPDWFGPIAKATQSKGTLHSEWLKGRGSEVAKLEIVEQLRSAHRISGALSDFRVDASQCAVSFKGPGYSADVFIERATGAYDVTENRMGLVAVINDLHKGRDTGKAWSMMIDLSAALMCLVSISGMVLIFFLQKRLTAGLTTALLGAVACYGFYALLIP